MFRPTGLEGSYTNIPNIIIEQLTDPSQIVFSLLHRSRASNMSRLPARFAENDAALAEVLLEGESRAEYFDGR